jgi:ketosteroid isomerase-like protein
VTAAADRRSVQVQEIEALEQREANAMQAADVTSLQALWADDLIVNSTANLIAGKQILLDMIKSGALRLASYERRPIRIAASAELAVSTGNEVSQVLVQSIRYKLFVSYMNVWAKRPPGWQLIARHIGMIERLVANSD